MHLMGSVITKMEAYNMCGCLLLVFSLLGATATAANKTALHIGGFVASIGLSSISPDIQYGTKEALEFVNRNQDILPEYHLIMVQNYTNGTTKEQAEALQILYDFIYNREQIVMLFAATNSMVTQPVCEVASFYNLVQVSGTASSPGLSDKERYPLFLRTTPTDAILVPAWEALFRYFKWKRIAIIFENVEIFTLLMKELVTLLNADDGYNLLTVEHVESGTTPTVQLDSLKNHDARIIVALAYEEISRQIMCEAYRKDLIGRKFVWLLLGWLNEDWHLQRNLEDDVTCSNDEMNAALKGYIAVKGSSYSDDFSDVDFYGVKPESYDIGVYNFMQSTYGDYAGFAYDAIVAMAIALNRSDEIFSQLDPPRRLSDFTYDDVSMATVMRNAVQGLKMIGVTGGIQFTDKGDRLTEVVVEQMQGEQLVTTGRYDVSNDVFSWADDTPLLWQGKLPPADGVTKIYMVAVPSSYVRYVVYTLSGVGICLSIICFAVNVGFRKRKAIKISSPLLNNFIILGCLLLYAASILSGHNVSNLTPLQFAVYCHVHVCFMYPFLSPSQSRPMLLSVGLSLTFGALVAKTYRIYAIFKIAMEKFKKIHVGDTRLIIFVVVMVTLDILICASWIIADSMYKFIRTLYTKELTDDNGHDYRYIFQTNECHSDYTVYWTIAIFMYKAIVLLVGVFLAWEIRAVEIKALNESRQIVLSVYVVAVPSVFTSAVVYLIDGDMTLVYALVWISVLCSTTLVLGLAFVPKILLLKYSPDNIVTSTLNQPSVLSAEHSRGQDSCIVRDNHPECESTITLLLDELKQKREKLAFLKTISFNSQRMQLSLQGSLEESTEL
ncbi:gamma-aminobutyric acid type B receptor subunit 2-like [Ptychodera flava]|uniref:gamma-aminobutyric acid type B receptor subunit 2-like n=1 Tax=Ptychodera flava TaxID=63121 RepID=UPI00396A13AC